MVVGRPEAIESVKTLILKLDHPVGPSTQIKIFSLQHMSAIDAEQTVRNFFVNIPGQGTQTEQNVRPGLGTRVRVIADFRTNSLVVHASASDMAEVEFLLRKLDVADASAADMLRVFKLKNALAEDLVVGRAFMRVWPLGDVGFL